MTVNNEVVTNLSRGELVDTLKGLTQEWGAIMDKFRLFAVDNDGNRHEATKRDGFPILVRDRKSYVAIDKNTNKVYSYPSLVNMRVLLMAKITAMSV